MPSTQPVRFRRAVFNLIEGRMLVEFDAQDREALVAWLDGRGFHFDWLLRVEWEWSEGALRLLG